jgi:hypothetical protein
LRIVAGQVILKFDLKSHSGCAMTLPFSEYTANVRGQGHKSEQVLLEESLTLLSAAMREYAACGGELQRPVFELGKL